MKRGIEIAAFCLESRRFVERADELLLALLTSPHSLREICQTLGPSLGDWPRANDLELVYALHGHLVRLRQRGTKRTVAEENSLRIQMRFAVAGELAVDAAKTLQAIEGQAVETAMAEREPPEFSVTGRS